MCFMPSSGISDTFVPEIQVRVHFTRYPIFYISIPDSRNSLIQSCSVSDSKFQLLTCVTKRIRMWDMTPSYVWQWLACVTWRIHMCDRVSPCVLSNCMPSRKAIHTKVSLYMYQMLLQDRTHCVINHVTLAKFDWFPKYYIYQIV